MSRILVTGSNGQLGNCFKSLVQSKKLNHDFVFVDIDTLNLTDFVKVKSFLRDKNFDFVVNCAAYTAVDNAEDDIENAYIVNKEIPKYLANLSVEFNFRLIHVSTDYVFDGLSNIPYNEETKANPNTIYGKSKLEGENEIFKINENSIIVRTSWLYSEYGRNFFKTITKLAKEKNLLKVVFDQVGTPTYAKDLARAILQLISVDGVKGIFHFSNEGVCSWYDFASEIIKMQKIDCKVVAVKSEEFPTKAKRPFYSVLDKSKIKKFNIDIPFWRESLLKAIKSSNRIEKK